MIDWEKDSGTLAEKYKGKRRELSKMIEEEQQTTTGSEYI